MSPSPIPDRVLRWGLGAATALVALVVLLILVFLALESREAISSLGLVAFFADSRWLPGEAPQGHFGLLPMIAGTAALSVGALFLAAPLGVGAAVFSVFVAPPPLARAFRHLLQLLAGVPSVVFGLWGLVELAPRVRALHPPGQSLLTGILVLALMVLPTVALLAETSLRAVPRDSLAGAEALGLGTWGKLRVAALPHALPGLLAGVLLAFARAVGETMAILMVSGNVIQVPTSVFDPVRALTAHIALEMGYATSLHRSALFFSGLLLMLVVGVSVLAVSRLEKGVLRD